MRPSPRRPSAPGVRRRRRHPPPRPPSAAAAAAPSSVSAVRGAAHSLAPRSGGAFSAGAVSPQDPPGASAAFCTGLASRASPLRHVFVRRRASRSRGHHEAAAAGLAGLPVVLRPELGVDELGLRVERRVELALGVQRRPARPSVPSRGFGGGVSPPSLLRSGGPCCAHPSTAVTTQAMDSRNGRPEGCPSTMQAGSRPGSSVLGRPPWPGLQVFRQKISLGPGPVRGLGGAAPGRFVADGLRSGSNGNFTSFSAVGARFHPRPAAPTPRISAPK